MVYGTDAVATRVSIPLTSAGETVSLSPSDGLAPMEVCAARTEITAQDIFLVHARPVKRTSPTSFEDLTGYIRPGSFVFSDRYNFMNFHHAHSLAWLLNLKVDKEIRDILKEEFGFSLDFLDKESDYETVSVTLLELCNTLFLAGKTLPDFAPKDQSDILIRYRELTQFKHFLYEIILENTKKTLHHCFHLSSISESVLMEGERKALLKIWEQQQEPKSALAMTMEWLKTHKEALSSHFAALEENALFPTGMAGVTHLPLVSLKILFQKILFHKEIIIDGSTSLLPAHNPTESSRPFQTLTLKKCDFKNPLIEHSLRTLLSEWKNLEAVVLEECTAIEKVADAFRSLQGSKFLLIRSPDIPLTVYYHRSPILTTKWFLDDGTPMPSDSFLDPSTIPEKSLVSFPDSPFPGRKCYYKRVVCHFRKSADMIEGSSAEVARHIPQDFRFLLDLGFSLLFERPG